MALTGYRPLAVGARVQVAVPSKFWTLQVGEAAGAAHVQGDGVGRLSSPAVAFEDVDLAVGAFRKVEAPVGDQA